MRSIYRESWFGVTRYEEYSEWTAEGRGEKLSSL